MTGLAGRPTFAYPIAVFKVAAAAGDAVVIIAAAAGDFRAAVEPSAVAAILSFRKADY